MNIKLPDPSQFYFRDCIIAGDECVLITPRDRGLKWTNDNKYFRSSVWRKSDMMPISLSWRKFMNFGECPEFEPISNSSDLEMLRKLDGSTLIVSRHNNDVIIRTRGTIDASTLPNGHEIACLKQKYPRVFAMEHSAWFDPEKYSFLYEWTTPSNRIVLNETSEPTLWLTGVVRHEDYSYVSQSDLDLWAIKLGVLRPKRFNMTLSDMQKYLLDNTTMEGVVVYADDGQHLKKIKTPRYIKLHHVFTGVKTVDHLFEIFAAHRYPDRDEFEKMLSSNYDWELVHVLQDLINELYSNWALINNMLEHVQNFLNRKCFQSLSRKHQAEHIQRTFSTNAGVAFALLDNRTIPPQKLWALKSQGNLLP